MSIDVIVGGLYGSEAKGHITQRVIEKHRGRTIWNIRVGGPNAGHTGYAGTTPVALRQIPVGVVCDGPVNLEIAAGSEIDLPVLLDEIQRCTDLGLMHNKRLMVHQEATMIYSEHKDLEGSLVGRIGSTGKGIGAARADRLMRRANRLLDDSDAMKALTDLGVWIVGGDSGNWREGTSPAIVVEGVQGYALGLRAGYYPKCTTSDCRAVDFLSMAGISPWDLRYANDTNKVRVYVVARVYPIRVAGNSGPMKGETTWTELGLPEERTTVTQKVRRVGAPDWNLVRRAVAANGGQPTVRLAVTMVDQVFPGVANSPWSEGSGRWEQAERFLRAVELKVGAPISIVASGPNTAAWRKVD